MYRRTFMAGVAGTALAALAGPVRAFAARRTLRVGTWKTAQTIAPFLYGPFLPEGVAVTALPFTNPADLKSALLAKSLDMAGTTLAHAVQAASRGEPVVVAASLCNKCSALVVAKGHPAKDVAGLAGARIGYVPGTMHEVLLREALARAGLSPERDVTLLRVDFFDMGTALARGGIEAFLSGEPFPALAETEGYGRILAYPYFDDSIGTVNAGLMVRRETVEHAPELVAMLVSAHARATRHLVSHREEWLTEAARFGTPRPVLARAAENIELAWDMDVRYAARVSALGARMLGLGMISREPDYAALLERRFVEAAP